MGNNDFSDIGDQIRRAVEDAIDSMNFKELNIIINGTISDALNEVNRHLRGSNERGRKEDYVDGEYRECTGEESRAERRQTRSAPNSSRTAQPQSGARPQNGSQRIRSKGYGARPSTEYIVYPPSRVTGILLTVFGSIGLGISLAAFLSALVVALVIPSWGAAWGLAVLLGIMALLSAVVLGNGNSIRGRCRRLKLYLQEAGGKNYCSIPNLATRVGKTEKFVVKDLKRMIRIGIIPRAHIDPQNTCLMLDDVAYRQYQQSMESLKLRTKEESARKSVSPQEEAPKEPDRKAQVIKEGRGYLQSLREANQAIPGEVISDKLYRLEAVVEKIFHMVDMHPEQLDDIERFMDYYLPTTVKLVVAYRNFDSVGITGENITMAKQEVEQTLDTINLAFERLLDDLYRDQAFDVTTDASVLQTILKKDGFLKSDFDQINDHKNGGTYESK